MAWYLLGICIVAGFRSLARETLALKHVGARPSLSTTHGSMTSLFKRTCFDGQHGQLILFEQ